jgi:hypothetical protein
MVHGGGRSALRDLGQALPARIMARIVSAKRRIPRSISRGTKR